MLRPRFLATVIAALFLNASSFAGTKYAVGTCRPSLPSYTTISQAVSGVPSGSTVLVCPGNYPEQILIAQPLTLEGVQSGGSGAAVVVVPPGGLVQYAGAGFYYQILVQTTGPVDIRNLAVDGTGGSSPAGTQVGVVGIFYLNSSGTVSHVSARNQTDAASGGQGDGIVALAVRKQAAAAGPTVTIQDNVVRGFDGTGIFAVGGTSLTANIKGNTVYSTAPTLNPISVNGIYVEGATATVESNAITGGGSLYSGLYLEYSAATVMSNTISVIGAGTGVNVLAGSNSIHENRIDAGGQTGVSLSLLGTGSLVQRNRISNSSTAVYGCGSEPASGFTVTGNTITDAAIGVQMRTGNTSAPNQFFATATPVAACP
ncbi:MAG: right-handed parallel beta-helix repeat-containing protein [Terriglobales bacterium]